MDEDQKKEIRRSLQVLWTKAVGTPDYDKSQWKELDNNIERLIRMAGSK